MNNLIDTKKQKKIIEKIIKGRQDPIAWINNNVYINHPKKGKIKFSLYPFQKTFLKIVLLKHYIITLKSRQVGMSTIAQAYCLWCALHYTKYQIIVVSANRDNAISFLRKLRDMYNNLSNDYKLAIPTVSDNKLSMEFMNGSAIRTVAATGSASRGESVNLLVFDEAAFIEGVDEVYSGTMPTISRAANNIDGENNKPFGCLILSTPFGTSSTGKWYYDMYQGAISGENGFIPLKVHWSTIPEYNDNWYIEQCKILNWDYRKIASELELSFVSSGMTYLPNKILDMIKTREPTIVSDDQTTWIFKEPEKNHKYVMGVDVSFATGNDCSSFVILDVETLEQVAEFNSNKTLPDQFADIIVHYGLLYNNCLINIERNTVGIIVIRRILNKHGMSGVNLYKDRGKDFNDSRGEIKGKDIYNKMEYGTQVTGFTRDLILSNLYTHFIESYTDLNNSNNDQSNKEIFMALKNRNTSGKEQVKKLGLLSSERLLHQLLGFTVNSSGRAEGKRDDLVFAMAHALYCYTKNKQTLLKDYVKLNNAFNNLGEKQNIQSMLDFHKRFGGPLANYTLEEYQKITLSDEEFDEINNELNNKLNRGRGRPTKNYNTLMNVWKSF